jgi:hypothetical protein
MMPKAARPHHPVVLYANEEAGLDGSRDLHGGGARVRRARHVVGIEADSGAG